MEITPDQLPHQSIYKLMIGAILPRPIGWISTVDADGNPNLAPFSFFNAVCSNPPTVLFCCNVRGVDGTQKDTFHNVKATGEFVVNIVSESLAVAMNQTAADLPAGADEFAFAGVTAQPSISVKPPRVAESLVHFECRVTQIITVSELPGGGSVVLGEVLQIHVDDSVLIGGDKIDLERLQPIGRIAGAGYARVNDVFELPRPVFPPKA